MLAWYLIYSKPQQERVALDNLQRQDYEAYLPMVRARKRRGGRYVRVLEPMFPRYLFVNLSDETDNWGPIRSTVGVHHLVRFGEVAARVPDGLIRVLRAREGEDGAQQPIPVELQPGDRVRVVDGVLAGYEAIFQARSGKERVLLLLQIADRVAKVQVAADLVEPAVPEWTRPG